LNTLATPRKYTWEHLQASFEGQWPEKTPPTKSSVEKTGLLKAAKLTDVEMGKQVKVDGVEEFSHIVWANKIERLANAVPNTIGLPISSIRKEMSTVLKEKVNADHTSWSLFCDAIRAVSLTQIEEEQAKEKAAKQLIEDVRMIKEQGTPSKALGTAFRNINIGAPIPAPQLSIPPTFTPPPPIFNNTPASTYPRQHTAPFQARSEADCMNDVTCLALPRHPNTPAGHAAYSAQVIAWTAANPIGKVNEFKPYPLTPGTSAVASHERWICGHGGHMSSVCTGTRLPQLEIQWCSIAATIRCHFDNTLPINVNYIASEETWTKEEYDQNVIDQWLARQGKVEGLLT
jgi:hypothetical protein